MQRHEWGSRERQPSFFRPCFRKRIAPVGSRRGDDVEPALTEGATVAAITPNLDASGREVITEVGNIVLNACLGVFGNLLKVQVTFAVPRFTSRRSNPF